MKHVHVAVDHVEDFVRFIEPRRKGVCGGSAGKLDVVRRLGSKSSEDRPPASAASADTASGASALTY